MCLIITGNAAKVRSTLLNTHALLADIFDSNPDGIGIMYGTAKGLKVVKSLPRNLGEATNMIQRMPTDDRDVAIHFRWTTHGHTNLDNCHPYDVVPGYIAMMHNGVLHTGNDADKARSDTFHFINDYLSDSVHKYPELIHDTGYLTMVAEFIGDNRFVFMDGAGRMSHVNHDQGIEHDGMWFSNTYAWSPSKLIPHYYSNKYGRKHKSWAFGGHMGMGGWDDENDYYGFKDYDVTGKSQHPQAALSYAKSAHHADANEDGVIEAKGEVIDGVDADVACNAAEAGALLEYLLDADVESLTACLSTFPITTINTIFKYYLATPAHAKAEDMTGFEAEIFQAAIDGDVAAMHDFIHEGKSASVMAEVFCYYCYWYELVDEGEQDPVGDGSDGDDDGIVEDEADARAEAEAFVANAGAL
jgi:predicted glutamine amidotransferase